MKRIAIFLGGIVCLFIFTSHAVADDVIDAFKQTYLKTAHETHELMELTGDMLASSDASLDATLSAIQTLLQHAETLKKLASQLKSKEGADEAGLMTRYLNRLKKVAESGSGKREFTASLSKYFLHFNNLLVVTPRVLKDVLSDHLKELDEAISQNNTSEISHTTEHFVMHANQMYYAAMIFGKKIWQKFSNQIKADADKLMAAHQAGDVETMKKIVKDLEKPVRLLQKIVKE